MNPAVSVVCPIPANPANDSGTASPNTWYVPFVNIIPIVVKTPIL